MAKFRDERGTPELGRQAQIEIIDLGKVDPAQRGQKVARANPRNATAWRRALSKRQLAAADQLAREWEAAGLARIKCQSWIAPVDGGGQGADVPHALAKRRSRLMDAIGALPLAVWRVVAAVVLEGCTIEGAASVVRPHAQWLPRSPKLGATAVATLLALGLDGLAIAFFDPRPASPHK